MQNFRKSEEYMGIQIWIDDLNKTPYFFQVDGKVHFSKKLLSAKERIALLLKGSYAEPYREERK